MLPLLPELVDADTCYLLRELVESDSRLVHNRVVQRSRCLWLRVCLRWTAATIVNGQPASSVRPFVYLSLANSINRWRSRADALSFSCESAHRCCAVRGVASERAIRASTYQRSHAHSVLAAAPCRYLSQHRVIRVLARLLTNRLRALERRRQNAAQVERSSQRVNFRGKAEELKGLVTRNCALYLFLLSPLYIYL